MKTNSKKYTKTIFIVVIIAVIGLGYYYYLSNREPSIDATEKAVADSEIAALTTRDILNNYPESPKEVVKLYARFTKAYYRTKLTDDQIEALGTNARLLFDDELRQTQTDDEFLKALKADIEDYRSKNRVVSDYKIEDSGAVNYTTLEGRKYASLVMLYMVREGSDLKKSYTKFTLRQDSDGRWKILFWELVTPTSQNG